MFEKRPRPKNSKKRSRGYLGRTWQNILVVMMPLLAKLVRKLKVSPKELERLHLEAVEKVKHKINMVIVIRP